MLKETVEGIKQMIPLQENATALECKKRDDRERQMASPKTNTLIHKNQDLHSENMKLKLIDKWTHSSVQAAISDTVVKQMQETVNLLGQQIVELKVQRDSLEASNCRLGDTATPLTVC